MQILLSRTQAELGRRVKEQQEQTSRNQEQRILLISVHVDAQVGQQQAHPKLRIWQSTVHSKLSISARFDRAQLKEAPRFLGGRGAEGKALAWKTLSLTYFLYTHAKALSR